MKKIINQKRYDTDTAIKVGRLDNDALPNDFNYCAETLYRKKTGEYFLHCEGNANSKYGKWSGNIGGWGEQIQPLSYPQAQAWAEKNLDFDTYESEFGALEDNGETEVLSISLPKHIAEKFRRTAAQKSITLGELLSILLEGH